MTELRTRKIGRDAKTGKFIPLKQAKRRKATAIVETVPVRGAAAKTERRPTGYVRLLRAKNQLTMPKDLVEKTTLEPGQPVIISMDGNEIRIRPAQVVPVAGSAEAKAAERRGEAELGASDTEWLSPTDELPTKIRGSRE